MFTRTNLSFIRLKRANVVLAAAHRVGVIGDADENGVNSGEKPRRAFHGTAATEHFESRSLKHRSDFPSRPSCRILKQLALQISRNAGGDRYSRAMQRKLAEGNTAGVR